MVYRRTERVTAQLVDRRDRILRAAQERIALGGFRAAHVAAIAAAADLATGTVYRYFPSKADLFAEVLGRIATQEIEVLGTIAATAGPARDRLAASLRAFVTRAIRGRRQAYALIAEPVDVILDSARLDYRQRLGRLFAAILQDGIAAAELPAQDVAVSAACLVGACIEALAGPLAPDRTGLEDQGSALIEAIVGFGVRAVGG
ncbi:MAG TPA: TetR/AcrR family transcriptional regulator [Candidatus Sulfotelmatobacter sp.]|nr:TetR/AcrR family transcriptional regulator [Candidatus Sulfotelmatobacter sp.]